MIFNMAGGGGSPLNFAVVGGTSRPSSPKENTIWIETSTVITGYSISPTAPASPAAGHVWITYSDAASAHFEAVRKSGVWVYPMMPRQYVSGAWVWKRAEIYQSGTWIKLYLSAVNAGVPNLEYTHTVNDSAVPNQDGHFVYQTYEAGYHAVAFGPVDLTPFSKLEFTGHASATELLNSDWRLCTWSTFNTGDGRTGLIKEVSGIASTTQVTVTLDITELKQTAYVGTRQPYISKTYIKDLILK